jgi:hypothetical protein
MICTTVLLITTAVLAVNWANRQSDRSLRRELYSWRVALERKKFNVAHARRCAAMGHPLTEEQKKLLVTGA